MLVMYLKVVNHPVLKKVGSIALTTYSYRDEVDAGSPQEDHQTRNRDRDSHRYAFIPVVWYHE